MDVVIEGREPPALTSLAFPLLKLVVEARNEHGMRQQDWSRYRRYCATKTRRVRTTLHLTHAASASKPAKTKRGRRSKRLTPEQQSAAAKGQGHEFVRRDIALDSIADARPLELLLFEAEHCWAAAEEIWAQQTEDTRSSARKNSLGRARKAVRYAEELHALVQALPATDAQARAQALAYVGLVRSALVFIQARWEEVLRCASVTRELLTRVAESSPTSRDEALASSFLDVLEAQLRFAAYSLGRTGDAAEIAQTTATREVCEATLPGYTQVVEALQATSAPSPPAPLTLPWRTSEIPIHAIELHDVVSRVQEERSALHEFMAQSDATSADASASTRRAKSGRRMRLTHAERHAKRRDGARRARDARASHAELDPFDRALSALTDAEAMARTLVDENEAALARAPSARFEAAGRDLKRAHEWLEYHLLAVRVARHARLLREVQARAAKREKRAQALAEARTQRTAPPTARPTPRPTSSKRPQSGSRSKRPRSQPKRYVRRPGRSGTRRRTEAWRRQHVQRAHEQGVSKRERLRLRVIPGLARLLDSVDTSLVSLSGLVMVESEPDLSSLLEAKRFYYCAELLMQLAQAFTQHALYGEALLLLQRAELYVRQATQARDLAGGAEDEDRRLPPQLLSSETGDVFETQTAQVDALREKVLASMGSPAAITADFQSSKYGQTLYYHALRHVAFDPVDVQYALSQAEASAPAPKNAAAAPAMATAAPEVDYETTDAFRADDAAPVDHAKDEPASSAPAVQHAPDAPFDPMNALEEEEERLAAAEPQRRKSGWLRGWFQR